MPLRVCLVASEIAPLAKTGGLGDVCAALVRTLRKVGVEVLAFLPRYASLHEDGFELRSVAGLRDVPLEMGARALSFSMLETHLEDSDARVLLVDCPPLYDRPSIYTSDDDEHVRFAFLSRASLEACQRLAFVPDVVHAHDWHTALLPLYLRTIYAWDRLFERTRSVLTIHNLAFQGVFGREVLADLGLEGSAHDLPQARLREGWISFLETGIRSADAVTTVSETYAREVRRPEGGMGLDASLRALGERLVGIPNGIDVHEWSPGSDAWIARPYGADDLEGKREDRDALLRDFDLRPGPRGPVLGIVSRLTAQKGFDLAFPVLPALFEREDVRLVALASGEARYEDFFRGLSRAYPDRVAWRGRYDEPLAHRIEAGADLFLMPSLFEPCGLNQMYSQRYGTLPVVRRTGGLADTVTPWDRVTGEGTGFVFEHFTPEGLAWALGEALDAWRDRVTWRRLQRNAMARDFSWEHRIREYLALYERLRA